MTTKRWGKTALLATVGMTLAVTGCSSQSEQGPKNSTQKTQAVRPATPAAVQTLAATVPDTHTVPVVYGQRKFPFPYQAMLAISSDADSQTLRKFNLIHEFMNTTEMTPLGKGLGLDFSDSFFMYNGNNHSGYTDMNNVPMSGQLTWFKGVSNQPYGATVLNHYIHTGWIDTMHTYGDFSRVNENETLFKRQLATQGTNALKQGQDFIDVWTDHGNKSNVDNFGSYGKTTFYNYQQGANPKSPYYHTDMTIPYGVHFVWPDNTSDAFGMNSVIFPIWLPDGRKVWGFSRYTNSGYTKTGAVLYNWTPYQLGKQLSMNNLLQLERLHQFSVVAQHLEGTNYPGVLVHDGVVGLEGLAAEYHNGHILVARTSRLLQYNVTEQYVRYKVSYANGKAYINVYAIADPVLGTHAPTLDEIRGVTFYTSNPSRTVIELGGKPIADSMIQENSSDGVHASIGVRWYPVDTTNYAVTAPGVF